MYDVEAGRRRIGIDRQSLTSSSTGPCVGQTPSMAASRLADDRTGRQREEEQTGNLCRRENRGSSFGLAGREPAGRRPQRGVSRQPVDEDRPFGRRRRIEVKSRGDRVGIVERGGGDVDLDRKSVVEGKSVSVRVDLGGRRIIKKKKNKNIKKRHRKK